MSASKFRDEFEKVFYEAAVRYGFDGDYVLTSEFDQVIDKVCERIGDGEDLGKLAYTAARGVMRDFSPWTWEELSHEARDAWVAGATAVKDHVS